MINNQYQKRNDGTVLNTDITEYERYKMQRQKAVKENSLHKKIAYLEKEVQELKSIVNKLIG